ncbi:MAG: DUF721 domain-containing protein [Acidobacteria bacterium]|nr:DUF721 domain-containing protein [Acidobacteriota bacterium]
MDRARDILQSLAAELPDAPEWSAEVAFASWDEAVGELLARVTRPAALAGRLLIVEVDAPEWVPELEALSESIRRRLNKAAGSNVIGRLVYRLRRTAAKPPGKAQTASGEPADPMRRLIYREAARRG